MKDSAQRRIRVIGFPDGTAWIGLGVWIILILWPYALFAANSLRLFSPRDLMTIHQIADPQAAPDGRRIAFSVGTPDMAGNRFQRAIYLGDLTGGVPKAVTSNDVQADNPRWSPDGRFLYYLAEAASGIRQVWRMSPEDGRPEPVTALPLPVESFEPGPDGRFLILSAAVFPGKTLDESAALLQDKPKNQGSGRTYYRLIIRHWDTWRDGTRNHLFVYRLADGTVRDLMGDMDADCPSRPFGGTEDFSLSPDGKTVVFSAKIAGSGEAWSTNYDLFLVPADGSALPKRITSNPAADIQPRFSPDGKTLAYLASSRPGHEADRFRVILRDMASGKETAFDLRADDSPTGDRSPDSLVWSLDGRKLYLTADHLGQHALFALDIETGRSSLFMKTGSVTSPRPLPDSRVLFAWSSLRRPAVKAKGSQS
ncbi:MAG: Dipeptidyl-peptidase 5 [Syntrophus sp. SKADARSKE-3]|nr:Dipeptidyl-peptidase 5 [Syntrophus sp. SKADARSKE-3]